MYNLVLAIVWLGLFLFIQFKPGRIDPNLRAYSWLTLVLVAYNLVRWWGQRNARRSPSAGYRRPPTSRPSDQITERDPNFVFDDPSESENGHEEDAPPSNGAKRF